MTALGTGCYTALRLKMRTFKDMHSITNLMMDIVHWTNQLYESKLFTKFLYRASDGK